MQLLAFLTYPHDASFIFFLFFSPRSCTRLTKRANASRSQKTVRRISITSCCSAGLRNQTTDLRLSPCVSSCSRYEGCSWGSHRGLPGSSSCLYLSLFKARVSSDIHLYISGHLAPPGGDQWKLKNAHSYSDSDRELNIKVLVCLL